VKNTLFLTQGASGESLDWGKAAGATGYHVYRGTTPEFMAGGPAPWQIPTRNGTIDPTPPSPNFFYVVRATDGTGESAE
jgi:hypothetical protein